MIHRNSIEREATGDTLGELLRWGSQELELTSGSAQLDAELLLARAARCDRSAVIAFPERHVDPAACTVYTRFVERRRGGVPMAYLLGEREFYSLRLTVSTAVLVPRPETELLVDTVLEVLSVNTTAAVLDLGTGSGALALALKQARPHARLTAVDTSPAALAIARENAAALGLDIELIESHWFSALTGRRYDLIVSNPPYVESRDPALRACLRHEPRVALDGGPDGLDAIRAILPGARRHLRSGGRVLIEHGEAQGERVRELALASGYRGVRTLRDLAGLDRVLVAELG